MLALKAGIAGGVGGPSVLRTLKICVATERKTAVSTRHTGRTDVRGHTPAHACGSGPRQPTASPAGPPPSVRLCDRLRAGGEPELKSAERFRPQPL